MRHGGQATLGDRQEQRLEWVELGRTLWQGGVDGIDDRDGCM